MKKIFSCAMIVAMSIALVSCGGSEKKTADSAATTLAPSKTEIKGDLSEYFTVVEKTYDFADFEKSMFDEEPIIALELQRTDKALPEAYKKGYEPVGYSGYSGRGNYGFGIKVKDADGKEVFSVRADASGLNGVYDSDDLKNLWELEAGETGQVRWSAYELKDANGEYKFEITSHLE